MPYFYLTNFNSFIQFTRLNNNFCVNLPDKLFLSFWNFRMTLQIYYLDGECKLWKKSCFYENHLDCKLKPNVIWIMNHELWIMNLSIKTEIDKKRNCIALLQLKINMNWIQYDALNLMFEYKVLLNVKDCVYYMLDLMGFFFFVFFLGFFLVCLFFCCYIHAVRDICKVYTVFK